MLTSWRERERERERVVVNVYAIYTLQTVAKYQFFQSAEHSWPSKDKQLSDRTICPSLNPVIPG